MFAFQKNYSVFIILFIWYLTQYSYTYADPLSYNTFDNVHTHNVGTHIFKPRIRLRFYDYIFIDLSSVWICIAMGLYYTYNTRAHITMDIYFVYFCILKIFLYFFHKINFWFFLVCWRTIISSQYLYSLFYLLYIISIAEGLKSMYQQNNCNIFYCDILK